MIHIWIGRHGNNEIFFRQVFQVSFMCIERNQILLPILGVFLYVHEMYGYILHDTFFLLSFNNVV